MVSLLLYMGWSEASRSFGVSKFVSEIWLLLAFVSEKPKNFDTFSSPGTVGTADFHCRFFSYKIRNIRMFVFFLYFRV